MAVTGFIDNANDTSHSVHQCNPDLETQDELCVLGHMTKGEVPRS